MDDLLINLMTLGGQGATAGSTSTHGAGLTEGKGKDFLEVLTEVLAGGDNHKWFVQKLKELEESGERGLALAMGSVSSALMSLVQGIETNNAPQTPLDQSLEGPVGKAEQFLNAIPITTGNGENMGASLTPVRHDAPVEILFDYPEPGKTGKQPAEETQDGLIGNGPSADEEATPFSDPITRLLSSLNATSSPVGISEPISPTGSSEKPPLGKEAAVDLRQRLRYTGHTAESEIILNHNVQVAPGPLTKDIIERNALFFRALLGHGGRVSEGRSGETNEIFNHDPIDNVLGTGEARYQHGTASSRFGEEEPHGKEGNEGKTESQSLIFNAAKRYKERLSSSAEEFRAERGDKMGEVGDRAPNSAPLQGDSFRSAIFQVRDNNIAFEKGSFASFVTERIEKIVEQFSQRSSQSDMMVRLKLDEKETLIVGLRNEGQKVIVDVKASHDSLVSLLQAHKDDIARNLEDKNIFTSIFVQPDGEKNSQRQSRGEEKKEERRQEADSSFANVLEATV